ncbi:pentapeptide repeat-containing protein [Bartonella kosoyi]|uniref:pentapeptide repeat-containing protein n=1 Tax=Bartonella kosoyi TaxID=2133959 RepID=UPI0014259C84|nr:pentapeptide repeat-containing protein [Bartonella kosoyi]
MLEGAVLEGAVLESVVLEGVVLEGAVLESVVLEGAVLEGAVLEGAVLESVEGLFVVGSRAHLFSLKGAARFVQTCKRRKGGSMIRSKSLR